MSSIAESRTYAVSVSIVRENPNEDFGDIQKVDLDIYPTLAEANHDFNLVCSKLRHPSHSADHITTIGRLDDAYCASEFVYNQKSPAYSVMVERF